MFLYSSWLKLPLGTRVLIAQQFGIAKVNPTHVQDNRIVSDGYRIEDVEYHLNVDAIQKYLGVDVTDMQVLFDLLIAKVEGREESKIEYPAIIPAQEIKKELDAVKPKRKYTKKKK